VYQKLQVYKYTSIRQLVCSKLSEIPGIYTEPNIMVCTRNKKIPLSQGRNKKKIFYVSGVAFKLAKYENLPAMDIANRLVSHLLRNSDNELIIQAVSPGWIHLEVAPSTLAAWLERLFVGAELQEFRGAGEWGCGGAEVQGGEKLTFLAFSSSIPHFHPPSALFPIQYAHARCCSLVRLGIQEGLIKLFISNAIPWLDKEEKLRFHNLASYHLINKLVEVVDKLECCDSEDSVNWKKVALDLSQVFEAFWCQCRIFGEIKEGSLELAQARLGLVMATRSVLKFLLEKKLNTFATPEI
jgi:arginyl-tRNA synthetase